MTPLLLTCTCLLLPCCVPVTLSSNELQFYRDGVADVAEDLALRKLARYVENQEHHDRALQLSSLSAFLMKRPHKKHHLERDRSLLETLSDEAIFGGMFRNGKVNDWNYPGVMGAYPPENERKVEDYEKPYYGTFMKGYSRGYPKLSYIPSSLSHNPVGGLPYFSDEVNLPYRIQVPSLKHISWQQHKVNEPPLKSMEEQPVYQLPFHHIDDVERNAPHANKFLPRPIIPEFTFHFDDSNLGEKHPFAVKPNDPRYYSDSAFFSDTAESNDESDTSQARSGPTSWSNSDWDLSTDTRSTLKHESQEVEDDAVEKTVSSKFKDISVLAMNDLNNDIYFIAIVAGCSAAAMFALVLISLTWCRLQRGVKAAADIEYPAYGVTGPNKDVSPSGDQRLAHSAQMYHFQHQKQQIIAMENRASAGRDPGSVSEAESDEENDEGHHTVYECPGLASTGELEVKNPLFHDDSIPVTPTQTTKQEDHM